MGWSSGISSSREDCRPGAYPTGMSYLFYYTKKNTKHKSRKITNTVCVCVCVYLHFHYSMKTLVDIPVQLQIAGVFVLTTYLQHKPNRLPLSTYIYVCLLTITSQLQKHTWNRENENSLTAIHRNILIQQISGITIHTSIWICYIQFVKQLYYIYMPVVDWTVASQEPIAE